VAIGWIGVAGGIICSIGFISFRNGPFSPPILAHLYTAIIGITIILQYFQFG
jgi:hypothetical protein